MKVRIASEFCTGHGRCYSVAPNVYAPDDEGYSTPRDTDITVPEGLDKRAARGKRSCPEDAITVIED